MSIRSWSGTRILLGLVACWLAAGVLLVTAHAASEQATPPQQDMLVEAIREFQRVNGRMPTDDEAERMTRMLAEPGEQAPEPRARPRRIPISLPVAMLILAGLLLTLPTVITTVWSWNRSDIGSWHFGKFLILWALLFAASLALRRVEQGLEIWPAVLGGVPLLALTWSWLSARERR